MKSSDRFYAKHSDEISGLFSEEQAGRILDSLEKNYYPPQARPFENSALDGDVLANLCRRQSAFERYLTPWVNLRRPLADAVVVDIGCGTGSSTAAFAKVAKLVRGYEIEPGPTAVAADRMTALRLENAQITRVDPQDTIKQLRRDHPDGVDVIALIAVFEHMTVDERLAFMPAIWEYMRPGDIIVVAELPNRLNYNDDHTAQMPFFHLLPTKLKTRYVDRSARLDFARDVRQLADGPSEALELSLARWGIGLSYHDFEIGLGVDSLDHILIADGYEHSTLAWWPPQIEEHVLMEYFLSKPIAKPLGFCRNVLNLIFVKPYPGQTKPLLRHDEKHIAGVWDFHKFPQAGLTRMKEFFVA